MPCFFVQRTPVEKKDTDAMHENGGHASRARVVVDLDAYICLILPPESRQLYKVFLRFQKDPQHAENYANNSSRLLPPRLVLNVKVYRPSYRIFSTRIKY